MIFTETAKRELFEMRRVNQERIGDFGICPLCERCLWDCKIGKAKGLINFWCRDFEEGEK